MTFRKHRVEKKKTIFSYYRDFCCYKTLNQVRNSFFKNARNRECYRVTKYGLRASAKPCSGCLQKLSSGRLQKPFSGHLQKNCALSGARKRPAGRFVWKFPETVFSEARKIAQWCVFAKLPSIVNWVLSSPQTWAKMHYRAHKHGRKCHYSTDLLAMF